MWSTIRQGMNRRRTATKFLPVVEVVRHDLGISPSGLNIQVFIGIVVVNVIGRIWVVIDHPLNL